MSSSEPTYAISSATLAEVRGYLAQNPPNYPAAYQAVAADLRTQAAHGASIDQNTLTWYTDAAQINDPHGTSFLHYFVRDYVSNYAEITLGKSITDGQFQKVSDDLAANVLGHISDGDPVHDFNVVGQQDTRNAVAGFAHLGIPVDQYAWPAFADSVSLLRGFQNETWLKNLTPEQKNIIAKAVKKAGFAAAAKAGYLNVPFSDDVNAIYLFGMEDLGATQAEWNRLDGEMKSLFPSPLERAQYYKALAQQMAGTKPVPPHEKLHHMLLKSNPQLPSVAPIPGRAGQQKTPLSPRAGTGDAAGLSGISRLPGAGASLTTGSSTGHGAALTGYRKVIADAHAQATEARARREAGRTAMGLASHGGDLSGRSFAPVGGAGAAGRPAGHATRGGAVDQDQLAASPFPSHTAADALYPRPQPNSNDAADSSLPSPQHSPGSLPPHALEQALNDYFFRQSRLPPNGGAAFNPYLSPLWAGLKLPG